MVNYLDPKRKFIKLVLSREDCHEIRQNVYVKDLRIIKNKSPDRIFLVDNCAYSYGYQIDNGIPIVSYHEGKDDMELRYLEQYLHMLNHQPNPLTFNREYFRTYYLAQEAKFEDAFAKIMNICK